MLDFWIKQAVNWEAVFTENDCSQKLLLWQKIESMRSRTVFIDQIETTNACSFTCIMCPRGQGLMTRSVMHMNMKLFQRLTPQIEEAYQGRKGTKRDPRNLVERWPRESIELTGLRLHHFGSPLMDPKFILRVEWLKRNCTFPVHVSVSAEHLTGNMARRLIASGIDRVVVALDGSDQVSYSAVRGKLASYSRAYKGIQALLAARSELDRQTMIDVQIVNLGQNPASIGEARDRWISMGAGVIIKPFFPYPDITLNLSLVPTWKGPCIWPFVTMVVTVDGRVVPCCADYNTEEVIGDASSKTLQEIWDGDRFRDFRRRFLLECAAPNSVCGRCGYYFAWDKISISDSYTVKNHASKYFLEQ